MTLALEHDSAVLPALEIAPRRFTFAEFERMSDAGLFADEHVELLDGSVFVKGMQSPRHAYAITRLTERMMFSYQDKAVVSAQLPLILSSPPPDFVEPDVAILQLPETLYNDRNPTSADALLVLEVRRDPSGEDYLETRKYKVGQSVAMLEFTDVKLEWWVS